MKTIRIGNAAGFWGDNLDAPRLLAERGRLDYLTLEYLAELTLSILAHQKSRDPDAGFVTDFPTVIDSLTPALSDQPELKIVTNAGGMNPCACARQVSSVLSAAGLGDVSIATLTGDDLLPELGELLASGETLANLETGQPLDNVRELVASANAYLGAAGIVDALAQGARIVITGRVADASLAVGPAVHEFGWAWDDWDRLAAATVAGHLIECGAQVTGGMFSDWTSDIDLADIGYPIAELADDDTSIITKSDSTGGTVTTATVAEQLVYEIGDPAHYLTPDVDADFSHVCLASDGPDRVSVSGARGGPAPATYKVSLAYRDGYMAAGTLVIRGGDAEVKARAAADVMFARLRRAGAELSRTHVEVLGTGGPLAQHAQSANQSWEVVLRVTAHDSSKVAVERFTREFAPLVTSGPPGVTGYTGPRPRPHAVLAYWPTTINRDRVTPVVTVQTAKEWIA